MNKISKKIVALATMAAFVLTLVPAAAFAAPTTPSYGEVQENSQEITLENGKAVAKVDITVDAKDAGNNVVVWLTTGEDQDIYYYATVGGDGKDIGGNFKGAAVIENAAAKTYTVTFTFDKAGEYTVNAGVDYGNNAATIGELDQTFDIDGVDIISVDSPAINGINVWYMNTSDKVEWKDYAGDLYLIDKDFDADGIQVYTMDTRAYVDGNVVPYATITVESGNDNVLTIENEDADPDTEGIQVVADKNGVAKISFRMNDNRNVPITLSAGDVEYTLKVIKEQTTAYDIDVVEDGGYVLAGKEDAVFSDAVQFSITDVKGSALSDELKDEPAFQYTGKKISVESKGKGSTLTANELALYWDGSAYTLKYQGDNAAKDLVPGKYVVRVGLNSGDYAEVTFNVAKFGTVQDTVLTITAYDRSTWQEGATPARVVDVTDEITLDQNVVVKAQYVDENGLKMDADNIKIGAQGRALVDNKFSDNGKLTFQTVDDNGSNQTWLGTKVYITAFGGDKEQVVEKELTVVEAYNTLGLDFDKTEGPVNEDQTVAVKVVKEDGSVAQVEGTIVGAYVADQSNEDAKVTVDIVNKGDVTDGKGYIKVYASKPTTADIVVAVQDDSNHGLYAGTLEYTAGTGNMTAHHEVTMTIGASQYVCDKQLFEMDAAPYVDSNWRTMVPIRALAEAFDAEVVYDNDDRTVTIEYNDKTIVMTVDESTYTIDGEEAEMDSEAVIKGDRTYVPVRFAAEAMGFKVTALYDDNSSTASVVFQS